MAGADKPGSQKKDDKNHSHQKNQQRPGVHPGPFPQGKNLSGHQGHKDQAGIANTGDQIMQLAAERQLPIDKIEG